jgi:hypothetical protein
MYLGQEMVTLFNNYQEAGNYVATFDGTKLPSGVYIYRLNRSTSIFTKRFVLVK